MIAPSFLKSSFLGVFSSPWLYPSNCEERAVDPKRSLKEANEWNEGLFEAKALPARSAYEEPVRVIARTVFFAAAYILHDTVGVVVYAKGLVEHTAVLLRSTTEEERVESWKQIADHAKGLFMVLGDWASLIYGYYYWSSSKLLRVTYYVVGGIGLGGLVTMGIQPLNVFRFWIGESERAALYKSICLRKEFGIVSSEGGLLPYDAVKDNENFDKADSLRDLWDQQGFAILEFIQALQRKLPAELRMPPIGVPTDPEADTLVNLTIRVAIRQQVPGIQEAQRLEYKKLRARFDRAARLLEECLTIKEGKKFPIPAFPFDADFVRDFYEIPDSNSASKVVGDWESFREKAVKELGDASLSSNALYQQTFQSLKQGKSPEEVLGFAKDAALTQSQLNAQYRKYRMAVAPDKHLEKEASAQATELSKCLHAAYGILFKKAVDDGKNGQKKAVVDKPDEKKPALDEVD